MRLMKFFPPILVLALIVAARPALSQAVPAYQAHGMNLSVGAGPSSWDVDWGHGRMWGGAAWADWYPGFVPASAHGLGLEFEVRDISQGQSASQVNVRQDTAEGGPIYSWRRFNNFRPYAKILGGFGSFDFFPKSVAYHHDTRGLFAGGGGIEYRVYGPLWARADYEYQVWQVLLHKNPDPQGFTFGLSYAFSPRAR